MADTQRTRAAILALMADNVTGQMSLQDLRDFTVTVMETEFANPGDFWKQASVKNLLTDKSAKGWIDYSQTVNSAVSFMNLVALDSDGGWVKADVADSTINGMVGLAMDSYVSSVSTAQVLRKGIVYDSSFSGTFSGFIGRPVYMASGVPGSITITQTTNSEYIVGWVEGSDAANSAIGKWRFEPQWAIKGV
jgi:hypothetical protein